MRAVVSPPTRYIHTIAEFSVRLCSLIPNPPALAQLLGLQDDIPRAVFASDYPIEQEALSLALSFPRRIKIQNTPLVEAVANMLRDSGVDSAGPREICVIYFLAALPDAVSRTVLARWATQNGLVPPLATFFAVQRDFVHSDDSYMEVLGIVADMLATCATFDVRDRYVLCRDHVMRGWPVYAKESRDVILVFLAHFAAKWSEAYIRALRLPEKDIRRARELARLDKSILAIAISRISLPDIRLDFLERFSAAYYDGAPQLDSETVALRKALALCTVMPLEMWRAFGWSCTPRERRALTRLANEGFTPTIREAVQLTLCQMRE